MNIAYLNFEDVIGRRFNGYDLMRHYRRLGHRSTLYVWLKNSSGSEAELLFPHRGRVLISGLFRRLGAALSLPNVIQPPRISHRRGFRECDILHAQVIVHDYVSIFEFLLLAEQRPLVMTIHDMSSLTGHCIHPPEGCERWTAGCRPCPHLDEFIPLRRDTASLLLSLKRWVFRRCLTDVVVASKWMLERVERSPVFDHCEKHLVPFGLDLGVFKPGDAAKAREEMGIPRDAVVIMLRASRSPFKSLDIISQALRALPQKGQGRRVCLLTCDETGLLDDLKDRYLVKDLGLVGEERDMVRAYQATDVFLMPSRSESFGMMAMEATACGVPCIVTEGTPLTEVAFTPEASLAVPREDPAALATALAQLLADEERRRAMGARARRLAEEYHDFSRHANRLMEVYGHVIRKWDDGRTKGKPAGRLVRGFPRRR